MRILMLALRSGISMNGQPVGGVTNNLLRLCRQLQNQGHEITILTTMPEHPIDTTEAASKHGQYYDQRNVILSLKPHGRYPGLIYGLSFLIMALILSKRLHKHKSFDLVHGHSAFPLFGFLVRLIGLRLRIPCVLTLYSPIRIGLDIETYLRYLQNPWIIRNIFLRNIVCIATSEFVRQSLMHIGFQPTFKAYPLTDFSRFKPLPEEKRQKIRERFGLKKGTFVLFYLGNLTRTKGLFDLIHALKIIKHEIEASSVRLIIALDMPQYKSELILQPIFDKVGLAKIPIHIGITRNIEEIMSASDLVIIPFRNTFGPADPPLSILEAMASGSAVLTTGVGGLLEIVDDGVTGFLVNPGAIQELSNKISETLNNRTRIQQMGNNAAANIRKHLQPEKQVATHLHAYRIACINENPVDGGHNNG